MAAVTNWIASGAFVQRVTRRRTRIRFTRSISVVAALAVAMTPELAQAVQMPRGATASHGAVAAGRVNIPAQAMGSADGKSNKVSADKTRAQSDRTGHPGKAPHELAPATTHDRVPDPRLSTTPASSPISKVNADRPKAPTASSFDVTRSVRQKAGDDRTVVYQNPDGTMSAHLYGDRVQYRRPDGSFAPIDDSLVADQGGRWHTAADSLSVQFAQSADDTSVMLVSDSSSHTVSFSLAGAVPSKAQVSGATATYPGVAAGADLVTKAVPSGVKETLILHSASVPTTWIFPYRADGLSAGIDSATGDVVFTDTAGTAVMRVPHGSMADSHVDPATHDSAVSSGVTYSLVTYQGSPALQVTLDAGWLHDPARVFPVVVDPTSTLTVSSSTYTENIDNTGVNSGSPLMSVGTPDNGVHQATSFLAFSNLYSTFKNDWIRGAWLNLYDTYDSSCTPEPVYVHPIASSWDVTKLSTATYGYPGVSIGAPVLGSKSFASSPGCTGSQGTGNWATIGLDATTVDNYAHGSDFYGLAVTAQTTDTSATWKQFASLNGGSANAPYLAVDYSPYGVKWPNTPTWVQQPTSSNGGTIAVPVENWGNTNWTSTNGYSLHYTLWDLSKPSMDPVTGSVGVPAGVTVSTRGTYTFQVPLPTQPYGDTISISFDMYGPGNPAAFSGWLAPTLSFTYQDADLAPQIQGMAPAPGVTEGTLNPTLFANGFSPNNPPSPLHYTFWVCPASVPVANFQSCASSGQTVNAWTIPNGVLAFDQSYYWMVQVTDGVIPSAVSAPAWFSTVVGQPVLTSHLAQNSDPHGYDPESGNYTTGAVDATVPGAGMPLEIQRTYNTLDYRTDEAFGRGWSSLLDAKATLNDDNSITITYPSGQQTTFGKNADGTYTPPSGHFAMLFVLPPTSSDPGSVTLYDKSGTSYTFSYPFPKPPTFQSGYCVSNTCVSWGMGAPTVGGYTLSGITSNVGIGLKLGSQAPPSGTLARYYPDVISNALTHRALHLTWTADATGQKRVTQVATDPVVAGTPSSALIWTYNYNSDGSLKSVCPPGTSTSCTSYGYQPNSHLRPAMLDADPVAYWPLGEASGSTAATDAVAVNEGVYDTRNINVGFGAGGTLPSVTSATFNGSSSYVQLPDAQIQGSSFLSVALWFKTSTTGTPQMLFATGKDPLNAPNPVSGAMPVMYVGSDGRLFAHFWDGTADGASGSEIAFMHSGCDMIAVDRVTCSGPHVVNDGKWHQAVLTASGTSQALYVDGIRTGTTTGHAVLNVDPYDFVGTGVFGSNVAWPQGLSNNTWSHFNGQISDVAIYHRPLDAQQVGQMFQADSSGALSKVTLPSGAVQAQVSYDAAANRVKKVTDINGGTWTLQPPSVSGSSNVYKSAVLGSDPDGYWRLSDASGTSAASEMIDHPNGMYANVKLGVTGPFGLNDSTATSFDGAKSTLSITGAIGGTTVKQQAAELWFSTRSSGVLLSYSTDPVTQAKTSSSASYTPALYVGTDGLLYGELWNGTVQPIHTSAPVNDGKWHQVALSTDGLNQQLYLDGTQVGTINGRLVSAPSNYTYVGAGMIGSLWPDEPHYSTTDWAGYPTFFNGQIAEVSEYAHQLTAADVSQHYKAYNRATSSSTPVATNEVEDPTGKPLIYKYDPYNGGRLISGTDADGGVTTYGYDSGGYLNSVTDPDGDMTITGHDVRGNVVSRTPCNCGETSYYTYFPDDTSTVLARDPRNDLMTSFRDGRSADASDTNYLTRYSYNVAGQLISTMVPPTDGYPTGRTTTNVYTDGTTAFPAADGRYTGAWLLASTTTPSGATTKYMYFSSTCDIASITDPAGLVTQFTYDNLGRVLTKKQISDSYPSGLITSYSYDWGNRVLTETDPGTTDQVTGKVHTKKTTTQYTADGLAQSVSVADTTGGDVTRTTTTHYDAANDHVQSIVDPAGVTTTYGYDPYGNRAQTINANLVETDYGYSPTGHLLNTTLRNYTGDPVSPSPAKDLVTEHRAYDPAGRLAAVSDAMGRTKTYKYYSDGKLSEVDQVDANGNVTNQLDWRQYDAAGNITDEKQYDGQYEAGADFDAANRPYSSFAGPDSTTVVYDPDDHPATVSKQRLGQPAVQTTDYTYDPLGRLTSQSVHDSTAGQASAAALTGQWNLNDGWTKTAADGSPGQPMAAPTTIPFDGRTYFASNNNTQWSNKATTLSFLNSGDLNVYRDDTNYGLWGTNTGGNPNARLVFQTDGNLVIYSAPSGGTVLWASGTSGNPGATASFQDNGNLSIFSASGGLLWSANAALTGFSQPGTVSGSVSWSPYSPPSQSSSCQTKCPGSASFDGSWGKISTPGSIVDTSGSFSVSAWVKPTDTNAQYPVVTQAGAGGGYGFWLGYDHNLQSWALTTSNADTKTPTMWYSASGPPGSVKTGQWTHLVGVVTRPVGSSSSTLQLWVNGVLQTTRQDTWPAPFNTAGSLAIGHEANAGTFKGAISQVAVYNRPLSPTEITALYRGIAGTSPGQNGLVGSWALNDGSANIADDTSAGYVPGGVSGVNGPNPGGLTGGVAWAADKGGSVSLDGTTGAITSAKNAVNTGPGQSFTVSAWADLTSANGFADIVTQDSTQNSGFNLQYDKTDNAWAFSRAASDTANASVIRAHAATAPTIGQWTQLTGVFDASNNAMTLYVNGQVAGTATDPTPYTSGGKLAIGRGQANATSNDWFPGKITAVQTYSRALSASEVATLYSAGTLLKPTTVLTTTWHLDERGLPISMTDPRGNAPGADPTGYTTQYYNDEAGHTTLTRAPNVMAETGGGIPNMVHPGYWVGYDTFGEATSSEDPDGNIVVAGFDSDGRPTGTTRPNYTAPGTTTPITSTTAIHYDNIGQVHDVVDPLGNTISYTYDQLGDTSTRVDPPINGAATGGTWHGVYYPDGRLQDATDPNGAAIHYTYNLLGQRDTITQIERKPTTASYTTTYWYDTRGDITSVKTPDGVSTSATYDALGNPLTQKDGVGNIVKYGYGLGDRLVSTTYPDQTARTISYDTAGRPIGTADLDATGTLLRSTSAGYDLAGNTSWTKDALGNTTSYVYDARNQLTTQIEPVTSTTSITTTYGYDAAGNRTRYTDGNNNPWITTYNSWNLPESTIDPSTPTYPNAADRTYTTAYNAAGRPATTTEPGGVSISHFYDALGNLTRQTGSGAEAATVDKTFGYDLAGQLVSASAPGANETFTWDDRGLLLSAAGPSGAAAFSYSGDGRMLSRADAAGTTGYQYDTAGRLSTINDPITGSTLTYNYNTLDQVRTINYGAGADTRTFDYDNLHRIKTDTLATGTGQTVASIGYGYNADDSLTSKITSGFAGSSANTYQYDFAQRLTSWSNGTNTVTYGYDGNGNRTQVGAKTFKYNARNQLTDDGTSTYTYSARGTLTNKTSGTGTELFASDAFDHMIGDGATTYAYDALDRMVQRDGSGGLAYSGLDNNLVADGSATYSRDPNGGLVGIGQAGVKTLAWSDRHGDVVGTFTPGGAALTDSATYDPLGNVLTTSGAQHNLGYQGGWTDGTTKKTNMSARWYDPQSGSFLSRDTAVNSPNPRSANANTYGYGASDPLDAIDPTGHYMRTITWDFGFIDVSLLKVAAKTEVEVDEAAAVIDGVLDSAALLAVASLACGPAAEVCEGVSTVATWKRITAAIAAAGLATTVLLPLDGTDPYANSGSLREQPGRPLHPAPAPAPHDDNDDDACRGRCGNKSGLPQGPAGPNGPSNGPGNGPSNGPGGPGGDDAPRQLTPIDYARIAAARPRTPLPGQDSGIDYSPEEIATMITELVDELSKVGPYDPFTEPDFEEEATRVGVDSGGTGNNSRQQCGNPDGGWISYAPTGPGGRAQGAVACLTSAYIASDPAGGMGDTTDASAWSTPGYWTARFFAQAINAGDPKNAINACHLLGSQLGGSGVDPRNLATCSRAANAWPIGVIGMKPNMLTFESRTKRAIAAGQTVVFSDVPQYDGDNVIPYAFNMAATCIAKCSVGGGPVDFSVSVSNDIYGSYPSGAWYNLGR